MANYINYSNVIDTGTIITPVYIDFMRTNNYNAETETETTETNFTTFCDKQRDLYQFQKQNKFENFKDLTNEVDRTVDVSHILSRDLWDSILYTYYKKYFQIGDRKGYSSKIFIYVLGFIDSESNWIINNPLCAKDVNELISKLSPVRIIELLIEHAIMQGHQIFGVISDLLDIAVSLTPENKNETSIVTIYGDKDSSYSNLENSVKTVTAAQLAYKKQNIKWQNICASLIKYFSDTIPISGKPSDDDRLKLKSEKLIRFLYVYNHSNPLVVDNILSEIKYKHSMISNLLSVATCKFQVMNEKPESFYAPYDMLRTLVREKNVKLTLDIIRYLMTYYWKPVQITDDIYIYTGKRYQIIMPDSFCQYFNSGMKTYVKAELESCTVQFKCAHPRQFLYPTNYAGTGMYGKFVYYEYNTVYGFFERVNGCVQVLLFRQYLDPEVFKLGRFSNDLYNITADCMNALTDYKHEIEMSTIRLLFNRPIVPFQLDTLTVIDLKAIFQHNSYALSMSDYRETLKTVKRNTNRMQTLLNEYILHEGQLITFNVSDPETIFYSTFMWFCGIVIYILNCDIYGCDFLDIETLVYDLFGNDTFSQLGISLPADETVENTGNDENETNSKLLFDDIDHLSNDSSNIFNYENYKNAKDFMLRLHGLDINFPELDEIKDLNSNCDSIGLFPAVLSQDVKKHEKKNVGCKTNVSRYKEDKERLHSMLRRKFDKREENSIYQIVCEIMNGKEITNSEFLNSYCRSVKSLSMHNILIVLILTIHSMKRIYTTLKPPEFIVHPTLVDAYTNNRERILLWFVDRNSFHNKLWKFDFFTTTTITTNLLLDYILSIEDVNKYAFVKRNFFSLCPYIELISNSLNYLFTFAGNDLNKMDFLLRKIFGFSFPGQWEGKITMIDGESRSGKTLFCQILKLLYSISNSIILGTKQQPNSPHARLWFESMIGYLEDVKKIDGEQLKSLVTESEVLYRQNCKNTFTEFYPLCQFVASGNYSRIVDADTATKNRVSVFSINVKSIKIETPSMGNFAYFSIEEIKLLSNYIDDLDILQNTDICQEAESEDDELEKENDNERTMPYMVTQLLQRNRPVNTMMDKTNIAKGLQYVMDYFARYIYLKTDISDPNGLYNKSMSSGMIKENKKWFERFSPYDRWRSLVKCTPFGSGERNNEKIPFDLIERNMNAFISKYYRCQTIALTDLVLAFQRDYEKRYGYYNRSTNIMEYSVKFDKIEFSKMFK